MSVTDQLLRLHRVEQQLRGLRTRVGSAERYLQQQETTLSSLNENRASLQSQQRQLQATINNDESEIACIDERINKLRDQMNSAKSAKEYQALLTEINTIKADKALIEERALASMTKLEELNTAAAAIETQQQERSGIRDVAAADLKTRTTEIKDRLEKLTVERKEAAKEVPQPALLVYEELAERYALGGDNDFDSDYMAPVEEHSRRSMDFACSSCQTMLPVEIINRLLTIGDLTHCVTCGTILYVEESLRESMLSSKK